MNLYFNSWLFKIPLINRFEAITLFPLGVFFKRSVETVSPSLMRHEMIHVGQVQKHGVIKFYAIYVYEFAKNLIKYRKWMVAYYMISFEKEAYEGENK